MPYKLPQLNVYKINCRLMVIPVPFVAFIIFNLKNNHIKTVTFLVAVELASIQKLVT